jgi:hypothetical protein
MTPYKPIAARNKAVAAKNPMSRIPNTWVASEPDT